MKESKLHEKKEKMAGKMRRRENKFFKGVGDINAMVSDEERRMKEIRKQYK